MLKELREATGAGMMDCKKALVEAEGNFEKQLIFYVKKVKKLLQKEQIENLLKELQ